MLLANLRNAIRDERGGVAIIAAFTMPILVGGMALGAETGFWYLKQRKLQHAADMAAYAAALRLMQGDAVTDAETTAQRVGTCTWDNSADCSTAPVKVTVEITTPYNGDAARVRAVASETLPRYLTALFGSGDVPMSARAVARYERNVGAKACVLALKKDANVGVKVSGNTSVTFEGCDVVSNSGSSSSFMMQSGAAVITTRCIRLSGGAQTNDAADVNLECDEIGEYKPAIVNPLEGIVEPATNVACVNGTNEVSVGPSATTAFKALDAGHPSGLPVLNFCGGLRVQGKATFTPGIYLVGKNFTINSGATLSVDNSAGPGGVMFYLYDGAGVTMNGQANLNLTGITEQQHPVTEERPYTYAGLLFFSQSGNTATVQVNGGSSSTTSGIIYAPDAHVTYSGNADSGTPACLRLIGGTIEFTGKSGVSANCTGMEGTPIYSEPYAALID